MFFCIGCSNNLKTKTEESKTNVTDNLVPSENLIQLCYGVDTKIDTSSFLEMSMYYLMRSEYRKCITLIKSRYRVDTMRHSGFYGFEISPSERQDQILKYILFRYENFLDNLPMEAQSILLVSSAFSQNTELYKLQEIEEKYVKNNKDKSNEAARELINEVAKIKEQFSDSKRLDFILAKEYLIIGEQQKALSIYDKLIDNDYYSLVCLRNVIDYLSDKENSVLRGKYMSVLKQRFPDQCNIKDISLSLSMDSIYKICHQCIKSDFQKDSITAKLALSQYFLYTKNYKSLDSANDAYFKQYTELNLDSFVLYEHGMYLDLKMRSFFLQKKYIELCKYAHEELDYNLILSINNDEDFKNYIKLLYEKYISKDLSEFSYFFKSNFSSCVGR